MKYIATVFAFQGLQPATACQIFGLDLNPFDEGGIFGSDKAEKAAKVQKNATHLWTGGAKDPLHPNMVWDEKTQSMVPENTGMFGEIPTVDSQKLTYGDSPGDINPYTNGPGYIAKQMDPWDTGTSAFETRGPSAWGQVGDSAYGGLSMDPMARSGMAGSMDYFQGLQKNPYDAVAEADYARARRQAELSRRSSSEAALGNLEARGMGNSGDALLAQLTGAEGSAHDTYQAGLDRAAMGAARRDSAATAAGNMAGQLGQTQAQIDEARAQGIDTQAGNRANAYDAFANNTATGKDAWNNAQSNHVYDTNKYNADALTQQMKDQSTRERSVLDANTGTHNQVVQGNNTLQQQNFNNKMAVMGGATGQMNSQADQLNRSAVYPMQQVILPMVSDAVKAAVSPTPGAAK